MNAVADMTSEFISVAHSLRIRVSVIRPIILIGVP
jgi:hypothetical protein